MSLTLQSKLSEGEDGVATKWKSVRCMGVRCMGVSLRLDTGARQESEKDANKFC